MTTIGTNVAALGASLIVSQNSQRLNQFRNEIASGSRLANPSNDAAGVAVSANLNAAVQRLQASTEGSQNLISFAQTNDGFLSTVQSQVTRLSELAQRATNGAFSDSDRAAYQTEFDAIRSQISDIFSNASFNGSSVFQDGEVTAAIDAEGNLDSFATEALTTADLGIDALDISTTSGAEAAIAALNDSLSLVTDRRAEVNADISRFNFNILNQRTTSINIQTANSRIADADLAAAVTQESTADIITKASYAMLAQANVQQQSVLGLLR